MPELPDVTVYIEALERHVANHRLEGIRLRSAFLLRTVEPPLAELEGRRATGFRRLGKRIVMAFEGDLFLVLHLMIAGRLRWRAAGARLPARIGLAALDFDDGTLLLTEASTRKRSSLHAVRGEAGLRAHDPGGLDVLTADLDAFTGRLCAERHTLKRALCDPHILDGIGNAYSDEILHRARLSPLQLTTNLSPDELARLLEAARTTLVEWTQRLRTEVGAGFPTKVTAFRRSMAVHGRAGKPCPDCGAPIQRIVHAKSETNYCARCQTGGRLLRDRSLSRLLKEDWPRSLEELE